MSTVNTPLFPPAVQAVDIHEFQEWLDSQPDDAEYKDPLRTWLDPDHSVHALDLPRWARVYKLFIALFINLLWDTISVEEAKILLTFVIEALGEDELY